MIEFDVNAYFYYKLFDKESGKFLFAGVGKLKDIKTIPGTTISFIRDFDNWEKGIRFMLEHDLGEFNSKIHQGIICVETQMVFKTALEACECYNIDRSNMSNHLNNKAHRKSLAGLTFKYI